MWSNPNPDVGRVGRAERVGVSAIATVVPSLLLVHAVAAALHWREGISPGAVLVSTAIVGIAIVHALIGWLRPSVPAWGWSTVPIAAGVGLAFATGAVSGAAAVALCGYAQGVAQSRLARALPATVDGLVRRHPWHALGWSLLSVLAVVQTARLASHEAVTAVSWWVTTEHPDWAGHQCGAMYVFAADLHRQGTSNVYAGENFPPYEDPESRPRVTVDNLADNLQCGFEYPPQFLVLPWLELRMTNDFLVIRPFWFALNGLVFLGLAVVLCLWIGGERGRRALWLLPVVWTAVPTLQTFQFAQFHLTAFALALGGMIALEQRRRALGGTLLAVAVLAKIFPGVLMLLLAVQRRWRDLGATLLSIVALSALSLAMLGTTPFEAFLSYKLPGMLDGSGFIDPNEDGGLTAILTGVTTIPSRLRILGMTFLPDPLGPGLGGLLVIAILALVWRARRGTASRASGALLWLALLNLVVLSGPTAFVDYATATFLWILSFVAVDMGRSRVVATVSWIGWVLFFTLLGTFPFPDDPVTPWPEVLDLRLVAAATLCVTVLALGFNSWCALWASGRAAPSA